MEELAALKAEAATLTPAPDGAEGAAEPVTGEAEVLPHVDPGLSAALGKVVHALSGPICRKARVTGLAAEEAEALGASIALLVQVYDVGPKDPKGAAWMGFGLTALGIIAARDKLPEPEAPPPPVAAPAAPGFGVAVNQVVG